ncbi:MAG TPA: SDR family NAD(P)-dependent oxidoreductase [Fimbriimonadaceae bacterium]|nr:SDR family NAD(P)-dependent oxidoreductase [Fimbriimonadaceae bacterium]HRJ97036.1 SDR family NAD(P)-dependent oxidoreductase [Fimbriimonadaceae bacterium]
MSGYRHAIVIGASSGIGHALAERLAKSGCRVAAIARRKDLLGALAEKYPDLVFVFEHDVADTETVPAVFQEAAKQLGGLDLVIYTAGVMPEVGAMEFCFEKDRAMVEVNLLGAIAWLNQAAIRFQNTRHGTIVGIGSVAGDRGRCGQPVYNATKAALATYLEALRNRLARRGVRVVTIKPGPVQTEMTARLHLRGAMSAEAAARLILIKSRRTGEHYLKFGHWLAFGIIRNIPSAIFRRLRV